MSRKKSHEEPVMIFDVDITENDEIILESKTLYFYQDGDMEELSTSQRDFYHERKNMYTMFRSYIKLLNNNYVNIGDTYYISKYIQGLELGKFFLGELIENKEDPYLDEEKNKIFNRKPAFILKLCVQENLTEEEKNIVRSTLREYIGDFRNIYEKVEKLEQEIREALLIKKVEKIESNNVEENKLEKLGRVKKKV